MSNAIKGNASDLGIASEYSYRHMNHTPAPLILDTILARIAKIDDNKETLSALSPDRVSYFCATRGPPVSAICPFPQMTETEVANGL